MTLPPRTPPPAGALGPQDPRLAGTAIAESVLHLIGHTPMVQLPRIGAALPCPLVVKLEVTNPGGSAKDRPALEMILDAERAGLLRPGDTIVEPTSGNTGVGLAIVAAHRGYACVFVTTTKVAPEKVDLLRAYGAEVVVCDVALPPEHPESYYSTAERIAAERKAFRPNQYANPANPRAHEHSTGPEIWDQTAGRITHFVAGAGTAGTITGVARALKAKNPAIRIIAADPDASVLSGGSGRPYLTEGVGEDFFPAAWDPELYDEVITCSDAEAYLMARTVARTEGLLLGSSGGLAIAAALKLAPRLSPEDLVVVLIPDSGRGYLSRVYNDVWMTTYGFLRPHTGPSVADVLARRADTVAPLLYVNPEEPTRTALAHMHTSGVSQLLVARNTPPFAVAEVIGSVNDRRLVGALSADPELLERPVSRVMEAPLPTIGIGQSLPELAAALDTAPALVILADGRPISVLTRSDLMLFLEGTPR